MKRTCFICLLFCALGAMAACAPRYTALSEEAVLPRGVRVDGVAVGGMAVREARAAIASAQAARLGETVFTLEAETERVTLPASSLPVAYDIDAVLLRALNREGRELACTPALGAEACRAVLSEVTAPLGTDPQDARAVYSDGTFAYTEAVDGQTPDVPALADALRAALPNGGAVLPVTLTTRPAGYTLADAQRDTALLATFSTSFAGSTYGKANRVHNIRKAAACIDGAVLAPGAEFDMNALLGPRNRENGWREATAIYDGAYTQEYGGGVCQVSTTLYNAVLLADLTVTEREHHSWPLGYVDIGRDATISTGGPNFKFVNTTDVPLTVSARTDTAERTVTVRLYGRARTDGLRVALTSKKVETLKNPGNTLKLDKSLAPGERVKERPARAGSVSETYKLYYDAEGTLVEKTLVSTDKYRPIKGIVRVAEDLYYGTAATSARPQG